MEIVDKLKNTLITILMERKSTLLFLAGVSAFFAFPFSICSFVVAGTPNAGFNVVLTAILNICFVLGSFFVIIHSQAPIAVGFLLGASCGMTVLNLTTAIYWGQLSKCTSFNQSLDQYSCTQPDAYGAVCAFAVLIFLTQLAFSVLTYLWRESLIDESNVSYNALPNPIPTRYPDDLSKHIGKLSSVQTVEL